MPANAASGSPPAVVQFHGYGLRNHTPPAGVLNRGAIVFAVNAHGRELGREEAYYEQLQDDPKSYAFSKEENATPATSYFHGMALRVLRALQYVKTRPEWNGKELQSNGGSQGSLQSLWAAGLDRDVTSGSVWSPWCCDLGGTTPSRLRGWRPDESDALNSFDPVFPARRIKAMVHLTDNYGDYTLE